jgi:hypothetical protein
MYEKKKKGLLLKQKEGEEMLEKRNMYQQVLHFYIFMESVEERSGGKYFLNIYLYFLQRT